MTLIDNAKFKSMQEKKRRYGFPNPEHLELPPVMPLQLPSETEVEDYAPAHHQV